MEINMGKILEVNNLNVYYKAKSKSIFARPTRKQVLFDVSFDVNEGEIFGIVGESGCGKSTLSKTILGMNPMYDGSVVHNSVNSAILHHHNSVAELIHHINIMGYENVGKS